MLEVLCFQPPGSCDALRWGRCSNNGPVFGQLGEDAMERGSVCWVEVQDKVGWWPAQVLKVPPRVPEGRLRVRMYGTGEEKEIEADSESMSFDEPGVGQNLQKAPASDFANKAAHAQFKAAVAEAQKCLKEGAALSEESEDDAAEAEEVVEAQPQGGWSRNRTPTAAFR